MVRDAAQSGTQYESHELFISEISHLIFLDYSWPWVTETVGSETTGEGGGTPVYYEYNKVLSKFCLAETTMLVTLIKNVNIKPWMLLFRTIFILQIFF